MKKNYKLQKAGTDVLSIVFVSLVVFITCLPFVLMFFGSFKENYEIFTLTPKLLPENGFNLKFYYYLFENWPFAQAMLNSLFVTGCSIAGACFFCTISGFTFAKYNFPGKNILFLMVLATMMLPFETRLVPTYLMFSQIGGVNKLWSIIIPSLTPAFGIFLIRQFSYNGVPDEVLESARIEGASETTILFRFAFPMLSPGIFSLAIMTFMTSWNDFLWPTVIINDRTKLTVTAILRSLGDTSINGSYGMVLAATTLSVVPILAMYLFFNKKLISGILEGSGK